MIYQGSRHGLNSFVSRPNFPGAQFSNHKNGFPTDQPLISSRDFEIYTKPGRSFPERKCLYEKLTAEG